MSFNLKVMNNSQSQKIPALYLNFSQKKFFINFPDLHQRFLSNHAVKICEKSTMIITGDNLDYHAGLQGILYNLILRLLSEPVHIFLPSRLFNYIQNFKFIYGKKFLEYSLTSIDNIDLHQKGASFQFLENEDINLEKFFTWDDIKWPQEKLNQLIDGRKLFKKKSQYFSMKILKEFNLIVQKEQTHELIYIPMNLEKTYYSLLFIQPEKSTFDKNKIKEFNLQGKELQIINKEQFIEKDGRTITKSDISIIHQSQAILIFDLQQQDLEYFQQQEFLEYLKQQKDIIIVNNVHTYGIDIIEDQNYYKIAKIFQDQKNIFVNADFDEDFDIKYEQKLQKHENLLQYLNSKLSYIFPRLKQTRCNNENLLKKFYQDYQVSKNFECYIFGQNKNGKLQQNNMKILSDEEFDEYFQIDINKNFLQNQQMLQKQNKFDKFPYIHFLGTGSMIPQGFRTVSSFLIGINQNCLMMIDCGEGTYLQLQSCYGDKLSEVLKKIKIVYISHLHGDHFFGVFNIIQQREKILNQENLKDDLIVIGPSNVLNTIQGFQKLTNCSQFKFLTFSDILEVQNIQNQSFKNYFEQSYQFVENNEPWNYANIQYSNSLKNHYKNLNNDIKNNFLKILKENDIQILPIPVDHCPEASGVSIKTNNKKIIYSGDCRYSENLIQPGYLADLLIHECTFDCSANKQEVINKGHSDIEDALLISQKMKSKNTILTHFSQKYNGSINKKEYKNLFLYREKDQISEHFFEKCFMSQDFLYIDFDIIEKMPQINNVFNTYIYKKNDNQLPQLFTLQNFRINSYQIIFFQLKKINSFLKFMFLF